MDWSTSSPSSTLSMSLARSSRRLFWTSVILLQVGRAHGGSSTARDSNHQAPLDSTRAMPRGTVSPSVALPQRTNPMKTPRQHGRHAQKSLVPDGSLGRIKCTITAFWRLGRGFGLRFDRRHRRRRGDRRRWGGAFRGVRRGGRAGARGVTCSGGSSEWSALGARSAVMRCGCEVAG